MQFHFIASIFTILMLSGCVIQTDKQPQADQIVNQLQTALEMQQWDSAANLYSPKFFRSQPRSTWRNEIETVKHLLGEFTSYTISSKSKDPRFSGDFYIYNVTAKHEHGFSSSTITIVRNLDSDALSIVGYQIKVTKKLDQTSNTLPL